MVQRKVSTLADGYLWLWLILAPRVQSPSEGLLHIGLIHVHTLPIVSRDINTLV